MRLCEILPVERVVTRLEAHDKRSALVALARIFAQSDAGLVEGDVLRVLEAREALASTGVGSGVAIPHGRIPGLTDLRAVLALAPDGIAFDAIDGAPATIFVGLLAPGDTRSDHLKALARISRLLRDQSVRDKLLATSDPATLLEIVKEEDERH